MKVMKQKQSRQCQEIEQVPSFPQQCGYQQPDIQVNNRYQAKMEKCRIDVVYFLHPVGTGKKVQQEEKGGSPEQHVLQQPVGCQPQKYPANGWYQVLSRHELIMIQDKHSRSISGFQILLNTSGSNNAPSSSLYFNTNCCRSLVGAVISISPPKDT